MSTVRPSQRPVVDDAAVGDGAPGRRDRGAAQGVVQGLVLRIPHEVHGVGTGFGADDYAEDDVVLVEGRTGGGDDRQARLDREARIVQLGVVGLVAVRPLLGGAECGQREHHGGKRGAERSHDHPGSYPRPGSRRARLEDTAPGARPAAVPKERLGRPVQHRVQPLDAARGGRVGHHEGPAGRQRDRGAQGVGRGVAEGTRRVHEHGTGLDVHRPLADALVAFARRPLAEQDRGIDPVEVVQTERQLLAQRDEVERVHQGVDAIERLSLERPAQERLVRRARLRGVEAERLVQRPRVGRPGDLRALPLPVPLPERGAHPVHLRVQGRLALANGDAFEDEQADADAAEEVRGDLELEHGMFLSAQARSRGGRGGWRGRGRAFGQGDVAIGLEPGEAVHVAARPAHLDRVCPRERAQPEEQRAGRTT